MPDNNYRLVLVWHPVTGLTAKIPHTALRQHQRAGWALLAQDPNTAVTSELIAAAVKAAETGEAPPLDDEPGAPAGDDPGGSEPGSGDGGDDPGGSGTPGDRARTGGGARSTARSGRTAGQSGE